MHRKVRLENLYLDYKLAFGLLLDVVVDSNILCHLAKCSDNSMQTFSIMQLHYIHGKGISHISCGKV